MHFALEMRLVVILNHILFQSFLSVQSSVFLSVSLVMRLQKILINADFNGFSGIFEIVISAGCQSQFWFSDTPHLQFLLRDSPSIKGIFISVMTHPAGVFPDHRQSHFSRPPLPPTNRNPYCSQGILFFRPSRIATLVLPQVPSASCSDGYVFCRLP